MSLLDEYLHQRDLLEEKLSSLYRLKYSKRNQKLIEVLTEEIKDLNLAITELRRYYGDKCGYRPRTLSGAFHFGKWSE